ncbi:MAG: flagellar basal body-associated FliL family protein [Terriglobia bacterium]
MPSPMAETAKSGTPKLDAPTQKKKSSKAVIIGVALVLCLALGGGAYVFMSHRALANSKNKGKPETTAKQADAAPVATIPLESFLVNLADPDHGSFLKVGITLGLDKPLPKGMENPADSPFIPEIRDTILGVLNSWQSSSLLASDGKTKLKEQLLAALQKRVPQLGITDIYFTDFLIQQ